MFSENLVEFVDILPTLVEASGLPELEKCPKESRDIAICREGTSLLRISEGYKIRITKLIVGSFGLSYKLCILGYDWKEAIFYQQPRNYWMTNANATNEFYQGDPRPTISTLVVCHRHLFRLLREDAPVPLH